MTTTELIKILKDNEFGGITRKSREISFYFNGLCMPKPNIILSGTGDGIAGAEIDFDLEGEMWNENGEVIKRCIEIPDNATNGDMLKALFPQGVYILSKNWLDTPYRRE